MNPYWGGPGQRHKGMDAQDSHLQLSTAPPAIRRQPLCGAAAELLGAAVGDEVAIRTALERYEDIDMSWAGSREANLLKVLYAS